MSDPRREPSDPDASPGVERRISEIISRLEPLPPLPTDVERERDPLVLYRFQLALARAQQSNTAAVLFDAEARSAEETERRAGYEQRERDSQTYMAQLAELVHGTVRQFTTLMARLDKLEGCMARVEANQRTQQSALRAIQTELASIGGRVSANDVALGELRDEIFLDMHRIEERLEEIERAFWADVKARAKESHATDPAPATDDDPGHAGPSG